MTLSGDEPTKDNAVNYRNGDMLQRLFHACQGRETLARVNTDTNAGTHRALEQPDDWKK